METSDFIVQGQLLVHPTYSPGFIVLSYLVSLAGCATALELLHRRTSRFGAHNWYLLITSSIIMGGIGIWCMHFIGNRAIVLDHGEADIQIVYNSGFTAISFFLPIGVLLAAFYLLGVTERRGWYYVTISGVLTGTAVCGMHYVGQLGIANYQCQYHVGNVIGAAVIAVFASLVALSVFFRFRATWTNSWWKRAFCASILAGAVSGMHWTATVGTDYKFKGRASSVNDALSRTQVVIICTVLACAACVVLFIFAIVANRSRKRTAQRAQQLVLACAYFDLQGRIMVTPEGLLPNSKITNQYVERTFGDNEFNRIHPAFIWVFRASRSWRSLKNLIPGMKDHLVSNEATKQYCPGQGRPRHHGEELDLDFSNVFKELFCCAAQELADQIHQPLETLGILYEAPLSTGMEPAGSVGKKGMLQAKLKPSPTMIDVESGNTNVFGKGQFLFVCRQLTKQEASRLSAGGYRFAGISHIADSLSRSMQMPAIDMARHLGDIREYSDGSKMLEPGVHVACFILRPTVYKGFDVLVKRVARDLLPHASLPIDSLNSWQMDILKSMNEWTVLTVLKYLKQDAGRSIPHEVAFCKQLHRAISTLADEIEDPDIMRAKFSAKPIQAPCVPKNQGRNSRKCTLLTIRLIANITSHAPNYEFQYVPLQLFNAQQQVYPGAPDVEVFSRQAHRDFFYSIKDRKGRTKSQDAASAREMRVKSPGAESRLWALASGRRKSETSTQPTTPEASLLENPAYLGIMVTNKVSVDVSEHCKNDSDSEHEMQQLGTTGSATIETMELDTYVDDLVNLLKQ